MKQMKITQQDYIKANRKASRDEEIAQHSWPSRWHAIHKSKKIYDRKRMKAGLKDLPFRLSDSEREIARDESFQANRVCSAKVAKVRYVVLK